MKTLNTTTLKLTLLLGVAGALTSLTPDAQAANILADPGFDLAVTTYAGTMNQDEPQDVWLVPSGTQSFTRTATGGNPDGHLAWTGTGTNSGFARKFYQVVSDGKASTGMATLSFDFNTDEVAQLEAAVWTVTTEAGASFALGSAGNPANFASNGDAILLESWNLDGAGGGGGTGGSWVNITQDNGSATMDFDLGGTGYDLIILGFWSRGIATDTDDWRIDNVVLDAVPEPSSAALLGLGGLAVLLRRRR